MRTARNPVTALVAGGGFEPQYGIDNRQVTDSSIPLFPRFPRLPGLTVHIQYKTTATVRFPHSPFF
jgi:hypothetical protein